jgi:5'-3' exonuclease
MGIKAFNTFLKKTCPECFQNLPLLSFHGYRLAIDASNWVFTNMAITHKQVVMESLNPVDDPLDREKTLYLTYLALIRFLVRLMNNGITPIWVSDGEPLPEKMQTRQKRADDRDHNKAVAQSLLQTLKTTPILLRSREAIEEYKKKLVYQDIVGYGDIEMCRNLVKGLGIPSIIAPHDAETLCSALAQEGLVIGVWSTDTDNYALGTPLMLTGFATHMSGQTGVDVVMTPIIRTKLGLTQAQLRDLCIASGCDYNQNMPNIGPAKSYKFITKHNTLEYIIQNHPNLPTQMLNHVRCREILTPASSGYTHMSSQLDIDRQQFSSWSRDLITQYGLGAEYESLVAAVSCIASPKLVMFTDSSSRNEGASSRETDGTPSRPIESIPDSLQQTPLSHHENSPVSLKVLKSDPRVTIKLRIRNSSTGNRISNDSQSSCEIMIGEISQLKLQNPTGISQIDTNSSNLEPQTYPYVPVRSGLRSSQHDVKIGVLL